MHAGVPTMKPPHRHQRGVAVVIGSGSVKCAAALGLVNALNRAGIAIDMLVGCSAGCLYATHARFGAQHRGRRAR